MNPLNVEISGLHYHDIPQRPGDVRRGIAGSKAAEHSNASNGGAHIQLLGFLGL